MKIFATKRSRIKLAIAAFVGLIIGLTLGFLPEIARRITIKQLASVIDAPVQIEDVDLNLFTRRVGVTKFIVGDPKGGQPLVQLPKVDFEFRYLPLIQRRVVVASLKLTQPRIVVERLEGNRFNLLEIIKAQDNKDDSGGVDLEIGRFEIQGGEIRFSDRMIAIPDDYLLSQIRLETGTISTAPDPKPTFFNLAVSLQPGRITAKGQTSWAGNEIGVEVSTEWQDLNPEIFIPYVPSEYGLKFVDSTLSGKARYELKQKDGQTVTHLLDVNADLGPLEVFPPQRTEPMLAAAGLKLKGGSLDLHAERLAIQELVLATPNLLVPREKEDAILKVKELKLNDAAWDFASNQLVLGELSLATPDLRVERHEDGQINLARYFADITSDSSPEATKHEALTNAEAGKPAIAIEIRKINLNDGTLAFDDLAAAPKVQTVFRQLELGVENLAFAKNAPPAKMNGNANFEKGAVRLAGTLSPDPLASKFKISLTRIPLENFRGYIDPALNGAKLGVPDFDGQLNVTLASEGEKGVGVDLNGNIEARELTLRLKENREPEVYAKKFRVEINHLKTQPRLDIDLGLVRFDDAAFDIERANNGELNLAALAQGPKETKAPQPSSPAASNGAVLKIRRVEIPRGKAKWTDRAVAPEVKANLEKLRLTMTDLALDAKAKPGSVESEAVVNGAPLRVRGTMAFIPLATDLEIFTKGLPLKSFRGYVDAGSGNLETREGSVSGTLKLSLKPGKGNALAINASGKVEGDNLVIGLRGESAPLLEAENLAVELNRLSTEPAFQVEFGDIRLSAPEITLVQNEKGELNLKGLFNDSQEPSSPAEPARVSPPQETSPLVLSKLEINQGTARFVDRSVKPNFETELSEITVAMGKVGDDGTRTPLKLKANLDKTSGLEFDGWFTPFQSPFKIQLEGKVIDYDLARLNPYAVKLIQYEVRRGRVTTEVDYSYDEGNLDGENEIAIRHLQLGEQLGKEFEKQVGIPLKFALALLQDMDGRIRLQIPVRGDLNSPDFGLAGVIWKAVRNAFISFLTAPFRLLGNVLTAGGKITEIRIDPVQFLPGTSTPDKKAEDRLKKLAEFLRGKPSLEIEIRGTSALSELTEIRKQRLRREIEIKPGETYQQALLRTYIARGGKVTPGRTPTIDEIENLLALKHKVSEEDLRALANDRKKTVADRLTRLGIEKNRIFEATDKPLLPKEESHGQVTFELLY